MPIHRIITFGDRLFCVSFRKMLF